MIILNTRQERDTCSISQTTGKKSLEKLQEARTHFATGSPNRDFGSLLNKCGACISQ